MKKNLKLSLVCMSLIAGISALEAKSLEEAIENVDVSGTATYRYDSWGGQGLSDAGVKKSGTHANRYKVAINVSSKVNEDVKFNTRILAGDSQHNALTLNSNKVGDQAIDIVLEHVNFTYTGIKNTALTLGKQLVATPWTNTLVPFAGSSSGTAVSFVTNFDNISLFGSYFNQTNIADYKGGATGPGFSVNGKNYNLSAQGVNVSDSGENLMTVGAIGKFGSTNVKYTMMNIEDVITSHFVKLDNFTKFNDYKIKSYVQYSHTTLEDKFKELNGITDDDISFLKLGLNVSKGIYSLGYVFGKTGENGSGIIHRQSESSIFYWTSSPENYYDAVIHAGNISAKVTPKLTLGLYGISIDTKKDNEVRPTTVQDAPADEVLYYAQAAYNFSKNFRMISQLGQTNNDYYEDKSNQFRTDFIYRF